MKPDKIILVRHGESAGNVDQTVYGHIPDYAVPLTPKGRKQAMEAGKKLKKMLCKEWSGTESYMGHDDFTVMFYVSSHHRARQTYEQMAKFFPKHKVRIEPLLREQDWGHLGSVENRQFMQTERDAYGSFHYRFPNGESCADVYDRQSDIIGIMYRDFQKDDYPNVVVIVAHGMTNRVFLMRWFHYTPEQFELLRNPQNCGMYVMELEDDKYKLKTKLEFYPGRRHNFAYPAK